MISFFLHKFTNPQFLAVETAHRSTTVVCVFLVACFFFVCSSDFNILIFFFSLIDQDISCENCDYRQRCERFQVTLGIPGE